MASSKRFWRLSVGASALLVACATADFGTTSSPLSGIQDFVEDVPLAFGAIESENAIASTNTGPAPHVKPFQGPLSDLLDLCAVPNLYRIVVVRNALPVPLNTIVTTRAITVSYTDDFGVSWIPSSVPFISSGTPFGPYQLQWVDPAAVSCPNSNPNQGLRVFIASLATTTSRPFTTATPPQNGACIYVSDDGGQSFSIDSCVPSAGPVTNTTYDGASLACDDGGNLYAAFTKANFTTKQALTVDVWRRDAGGAPGSMPYTPLPDPFPTNRRVVTHPRLAATSAGVYLSVPTVADTDMSPEGKLQIAFYNAMNNAWSYSQPSTRLVYQCGQPTINGELQFRVGPDHAIDVGPPSAVGAMEGDNDAVRAVYAADYGQMGISGTCPSIGHVALRTLHCNLSLATCGDEDESNMKGSWTTPSNLTFDIMPGVQQFPLANLRSWSVAYLATSSGGMNQTDVVQQTGLMSTVVVNGTLTRKLVTRLLSPPKTKPGVQQAACPERVLSQTHYWGDYDDFKRIGFGCGGGPNGSLSIFPRYVKGFTDSRASACNTDGTPQQVGIITFR